MAAPNIDNIAASLRSCSLARGATSSPAPPPLHPIGADPAAGAVAQAADTTLELNSEVALPYHWEQCLDLKTHFLHLFSSSPLCAAMESPTGKIYYINWSTGVKSMEDPRKFAGHRDRYCSDEEDDDDDDDDGGDADDEDDGAEDDDEGGDSSEDSITDSDDNGNCSSAFSSSSSSSSRDTIERGGRGRGGGAAAGGSVLVAAGCRVCMMYVMIPKREEECPRCGGHVLHFSRSGGR